MKKQEQTLWQRISEVAEMMKDVPAWKRGSVKNERSETGSELRISNDAAGATSKHVVAA